jgi:hypothetical protein
MANATNICDYAGPGIDVPRTDTADFFRASVQTPLTGDEQAADNHQQHYCGH